MASPKLEKGYTQIVNTLLESIYRTNFTATEFKILLFIIRYTYGFQRKEHKISLTFISRGIGVSKRYVSSSVNKMINDNILIVTKEYTDKSSRIIKINKDCDSWMNKITVQQVNCSSTGVAEDNTADEVKFNSTDEVQFNSTDEVEFYQDKKELNKNINKNINKEEKSFNITNIDENILNNNLENDSFEMLCVETIIQSCLELYPNSKVPITYSEKKKWSIEVEKMKRLDNRTEEEIRKALKHAINDKFWKGNIRSTKKFREKFETLYIQSNQMNKGCVLNKGQELQEQFIKNMKGWLDDETGIC